LPVRADGISCVQIDPRLREVEPLAMDFVLNFGRGNTLRVAPGSIRRC